MSAATIAWSLAIGVVAASIWSVIWNVWKYRLPLTVHYPYANLRGEWTSEYEYQGKTRKRYIRVERQCWRYFSGTFSGEDPANSQDIRTYRFRGELISHDIVLGQFRVVVSNHPDDGAFMFRVDFHSRTAEGGIIGLDYNQQDILAVPYRANRV